jgi:cell division protein FtsX
LGWVSSVAASRHFQDVILLDRLDAEKELGQVVKESSRIRIVIFTSRVLEIVVALVVEHLVRGQVHGRVEELRVMRRGGAQGYVLSSHA